MDLNLDDVQVDFIKQFTIVSVLLNLAEKQNCRKRLVEMVLSNFSSFSTEN